MSERQQITLVAREVLIALHEQQSLRNRQQKAMIDLMMLNIPWPEGLPKPTRDWND